ncbi:hypothetical protein [Haloarchaeobius sp. HME9146]|uniref:hypothetical protein n=1 Tax=Haloarchaeobius sp. HME9146 TaxID=2978732 RepID=UPI0021BEFD6D|nr:hypothetical protein [Haloarchaeobius sp. HME9146]MCT9098276.1 hypothetical protein [Haloarchaeobius sp. HME9146]
MRQNFLSILFALDTILLVLLAIGYQFTEPGTAERAISLASFGIILATLAGLGIAIRRGTEFYEP